MCGDTRTLQIIQQKRADNADYGTTNADAGLGIGLKGGFENLIEKAIN